MSNNPPYFVIPYYRYRTSDPEYLHQTAASLRLQSDPNWAAIVVVDGSPVPTTDAELRTLLFDDPRFTLVRNDDNLGSGLSRNAGVREAARRSASFIMYLDSDDLAHPDRVAATKTAFADRAVKFAYSPFTVVDEGGAVVDRLRLTPSIVEVLEWLDRAPPQGAGHEVLRQIGLQTGYITLTSGVSVRTSLAVREPFPGEAVSEDAHTWFRYAAAATMVSFLPSIPVRYRIPQVPVAGSSVRARVGDAFYAEKARVDFDGFAAAVDLCIGRGTIDAADRWTLLAAFAVRLAVTMRRERQDALARGLMSWAAILGRGGSNDGRGRCRRKASATGEFLAASI